MNIDELAGRVRVSRVDVHAIALAASPSALLCRIDSADLLKQLDLPVHPDADSSIDYWIPHSAIDSLSEVRIAGAIGILKITRSVAEAIVSREARVQETSADPTRIYRSLCQKYHPDKRPLLKVTGAEVMRDINELWSAMKGRGKADA